MRAAPASLARLLVGGGALLSSPPAPTPGPAAPAAQAAAADADAPWAQLVGADPETRRGQVRALGDGPQTWVPAALWLASGDPAPEVRAAGLRAAVARCRREPAALCARLLGFFVGDTASELAWEARDALMPRDLEAALDGAPRAYKQDLLARLAADASLVESASRRLLRRLSIDDDAEVQDCAGWLLER